MNIRKLTEPIFSLRWIVSWLMIFLGCILVAVGFVFFISPYNIVPGGVYGASIVMHNIFPAVQVGTFGYMFDIPLMVLAVIFFGRAFGTRTIVAAMMTPGIMNLLSRWAYPTADALRDLDPAQLLGGVIDMSNDLILTTLIGGVVIGAGVGLVVRQQATTGGTDIIGMLLQKFFRIKFSNAILIADSVVVLSGLIVIGLGIGIDGGAQEGGWLLSFYSLITIYVSSRVIAYILDGASYDKLLFIITKQHNEQLRQFVLQDLDRSATYIKARGMYTQDDNEMVFLVVSRNEVPVVQRKIREIEPTAFVVVTDAYDTFGEGFKPLPENNEIQAQ